MKPKGIPTHRYMLTLLATFEREGRGGMKHVTTMVERNKKTLPLVFLKQSQDSVAIQLQYFGIAPEEIVDVTVLSVSYLGHMTDAEFTTGLSQDQAASVDLAGKPDMPAPRKSMFDEST